MPGLGIPLHDSHTANRTLQSGRALAALAVLASLPIAIWAATAAVREGGSQFVLDDSAEVVVQVLPGGPEWRDGIRAGQRVVALTPGERPEDWVLETTDGVMGYRSGARGQLEEVREVSGFGVAAIVLALLALVVIPVRPAASVGLSATSAGAASIPLSRVGDYPWSLVAVVVLALVAAWLALLAPPRTRPAIAGLAALLAIAWLASRHLVPAGFEALETVRAGTLGASIVVGWLAMTPWRRLVADAGSSFPNRVDVALATVVIVLAAGAIVAGIPPWLIVVAVVITVIAYPRGRGRIVDAVDRLFVAETRERAAVGAVEEERARLARDLHDVPLQELSAVIRRLELAPETAGQATALRSVAEHLRGVATDLHPPQLADLGLEAAFRHLARLADRAGPIPVELDVEREASVKPASRPPSDVEVALYRIAQEAIANAQRHSGASLIVVSLGFANRPRIALSVRDDGGGIQSRAIEAAQRDGHFGIVTMRQRAAMVGARLDVRSSTRGTEVRVEWPA